jgi:hypothetical protein
MTGWNIGPSRKLGGTAPACPCCGAVLSGFAVLTEPGDPALAVPDVGSVSVCIYCASALMWTGPTSLRLMDRAEVAQLTEAQPEFREVLQAAALTVAAGAHKA